MSTHWVPGLAADDRPQGEGEGYGDTDESGHQRRGMEEHSEVGQQGVDALAVEGITGSLAKGLAMKAMTARKKVCTSIMAAAV